MAGGIADLEPAYRPGQRVRVRRAFPPGHVRTPHYVRGLAGEILSVAGIFANPEELAYGRPGRPGRALYRVAFRQVEIWPDYSGPAADSLVVDLFEHWLETTGGHPDER